MPVSQFAVNASISAGKEQRPASVFGLRSNESRGYTVGMEFVPQDAISLGLEYDYEKYNALQASRQANPGPQFDDPTRDWTTDSNDRAHTVTAALDLLKLWPRTELRSSYSFSHARSRYVYGLTPNTTLPPVSQLPAVINELHRATVDGRYFLSKRVAAGVVYWFDKYLVNDFALGPLASLAQPPTASPTFLMLGYFYRPYTANTLMGRLTYLW